MPMRMGKKPMRLQTYQKQPYKQLREYGCDRSVSIPGKEIPISCTVIRSQKHTFK